MFILCGNPWHLGCWCHEWARPPAHHAGADRSAFHSRSLFGLLQVLWLSCLLRRTTSRHWPGTLPQHQMDPSHGAKGKRMCKRRTAASSRVSVFVILPGWQRQRVPFVGQTENSQEGCGPLTAQSCLSEAVFVIKGVLSPACSYISQGRRLCPSASI